MLVVGAGFREPAPLRALSAPDLSLDDHPLLRPGVASVFDALSVADEQLAAVQYRRGELLEGEAAAAIVRDVARRSERGACRAVDVEQIRGAQRLAGPGSARLVGSLAFVEAEVLRCLGDEHGAVDAWSRAAANPRLRPVVANRLMAGDAVALAVALTDPRRPAAGAVALWAQHAAELDPMQRRAALDRLATVRPADWLVPRVEAARFALLDASDPRGAAIARAEWLAEHPTESRWRGRLDTLLADPYGGEVVDTSPRVHDALFTRAERAARAGRRTEARGLVRIAAGRGWIDPAEERRFDEWLGALVDLGSSRRDDRGRERLEALVVTGGRVSLEAAWSLVGDARRGDRDREALDRLGWLHQRDRAFREAERLEACVVLSGHLGDLDLQRACFAQRTARAAPPDAVGLLAIDVVVDHVAAGEIRAARALFDDWDAAPWFRSIGPSVGARLAYWRARVAWDARAGDEAVTAWEQVRATAPLSYEGVLADAWLVRAGQPSRLRALLRAAFASDAGAARLEPQALAGLELLELGFDDLARTELAWQSQLFGGGAPVAGAAAAAWMSARGERGAAIWTMGRQAEPHRWSRDTVVDVPSAAWRAGWPLAQTRPLRAAESATGQPTSRLLAFARRESAFSTDAVSGAGARGLMQLLPETARIQARDVADIERVTRRDLDDPWINARLGAQMLVAMGARYDDCVERMAAAYSAGPGRADDWDEATPGVFNDVWTERIPYPIVRDYAREIVVSEAIYAALLDEPHRSALCVRSAR